MDNQVFVVLAADDFDRLMDYATRNDDASEVASLTHAAERGAEAFTAWCVEKRGSVIGAAGREARLLVPAAALGDLPGLMRQFEEATGSTVSIGVGARLSEAAKALEAARKRGGDQVALYGDDVEAELEESPEETPGTEEAPEAGETRDDTSLTHFGKDAPACGSTRKQAMDHRWYLADCPECRESEAYKAAQRKSQEMKKGEGNTLRPHGQLASEPGYLYHATNQERAHDIARSGALGVHRPGDFTDQDAWPDGGTEKRNYWSPKAHAVWSFAPEEGEPVVLRTRAEGHPFRQEGTGDVYSRNPVASHRLEIGMADGTWKPLHDWAGVPAPKPVRKAEGDPATDPAKVAEKQDATDARPVNHGDLDALAHAQPRDVTEVPPAPPSLLDRVRAVAQAQLERDREDLLQRHKEGGELREKLVQILQGLKGKQDELRVMATTSPGVATAVADLLATIRDLSRHLPGGPPGPKAPEPVAKAEPVEKKISDLGPGKQLASNAPGTEQYTTPHVRQYDYSHLLGPAAQEGYKLHVHDIPFNGTSRLRGVITHGEDRIGVVSGAAHHADKSLSVTLAEVDPAHRGHGLGMAGYEAIMAHAYHGHGARRVVGSIHSTMADAAHKRLAAKHGMTYSAEQIKPSGGGEGEHGLAFDDAFGPYEYELKGEPEPGYGHPLHKGFQGRHPVVEPTGTLKDGKMKVADPDGSGEHWVSVRAGLVLGTSGHAASARNPGAR